MTIRAATADDVPHVLPMVERLALLHRSWDAERYAYRDDVSRMYDSWLRKRASDAQSVFLIADAGNGTLAGFLVGTVEREIPVYDRERFGFIHDVWIEEAYRHEGVGRQMVMRAIERFREIGCDQVRLETAAGNEAARSLFRACGFRVDSIEMLIALNNQNPES